MKLVIVCACLAAVVSASTMEQTDWSGGPGVSSVVSGWANAFTSCSDVAWRSVPGQIQLSSTPLSSCVEHLVFLGVVKPYAVDIGDINNDGLNDIVMGAEGAGVVHAYFGAPGGGWTRQIVSSDSPGVNGIALCDINSDGKMDILAGADDELHIFLNQGGSSPAWNKSTVSGGYSTLHDVESADMDADGDTDIILADCDGDRLFWLRNDGGSTPAWTELQIDATMDYPCKIHPVDINLDGNMDVVCAAWSGNKLSVFYGSGGQNPSWTSQTVDSAISGAHGARACDIDSDGDIDILAVSLNQSKLFLYRNGGGTPIQWTRETIGQIDYAAIVRTGDIDGDGDYDVISSSFGNAGVAWWENTDGGTAFVKHTVKTGGSSVAWAMPGDLDNDGDLDVLAVRYDGNSMYWYEVTEFLSTGQLLSSVLQLGEPAEWACIDWTSQVPADCGLTVQFRSSDNSADLGQWSQEYSSPAFVSGEIHQYFQYRINMNSSNTESSPIIEKFNLSWDPQGIVNQNENEFINCQNPCFGSICVNPAENQNQSFTIQVYSTVGRLVDAGSADTQNSFVSNRLSPGVYLITVKSAGRVIESRSVILL